MQIRSLLSTPTVPVQARTTRAAEVPADPADAWLPTGPVATPPPVPNFAAAARIEDVTAQLQQQFAERMQGQQKCTVAVVCERGWKPTEQHDDVLNICDAIMDAGGLPKLIYVGNGDVAEQLKGVQAMALPGGRDIDPANYGAVLGPNMDPAEPDPVFDQFEIAALKLAYANGMPLLGQCRGFQIMNVAGGGTMGQHIAADFQTPEGWGSKYGTVIDHRPEVSRHDYAARIYSQLFIVPQEGSRLYEMVGGLDSANAIHHQFLKDIAPMFDVTCHSLDGMPYSIERKGMPWQTGNQFHPEALRYTDSRYQGFFDNLVNDGVRWGRGELRPPAAPTTLTELS